MNNQEQKPPHLSRRELIQAAGAGIGALAARDVLGAAGQTTDRRFEPGQPLHEVSYDQVEFARGRYSTYLSVTA